MALQRIGEATAEALPGTTKQGRICNSYLATTIKEIIRIFPWNCAVTRAVLYTPATTPAWATLTAYRENQVVRSGTGLYLCAIAGTSGATTPAGSGQAIADGTVTWRFIGLIAAPNLTEFQYVYLTPFDCLRVLEINGTREAVYRLEGPFIYTNEKDAKIRYSKQITVDEMDAVMVEALVSRMASKVAYSITGNLQAAQLLYQEFATNLSIAKQVSSVEDQESLLDLLGLYTNVAIAIKKNTVQE